jgi:hypothetical protein
LKRLVFISFALACVAPLATTTAATLYAPETKTKIFAERAGEPHPKKLQMAFAVTERRRGLSKGSESIDPLQLHYLSVDFSATCLGRFSTDPWGCCLICSRDVIVLSISKGRTRGKSGDAKPRVLKALKIAGLPNG